MTTLLVLGSKPEPVLPPGSSIDEVACANASGSSAAKHGLPQPSLTVMSAILTSGKKAPNRLALEALKGLRTGTLYFYPRPRPKGGALRRIVGHLRNWRTGPVYFRRELRRLGFRFDRFEHGDGRDRVFLYGIDPSQERTKRVAEFGELPRRPADHPPVLKYAGFTDFEFQVVELPSSIVQRLVSLPGARLEIYHLSLQQGDPFGIV